jgi:DnaJ like chaperone protein
MQALRLDPAQMRLAIALFTEGKDAAFDLNRELLALRAACHSQPAILRVFMEIQLRFALWGSDLSAATRGRVTNVASGLGIRVETLNRIEAALRGDARGSAVSTPEVRIAAAYRTLEVDASVGDAELVKSYRRLMSRHHPDKLKANGLPDSMLEHAKQRTQAIREAYELLRGQRGLA